MHSPSLTDISEGSFSTIFDIPPINPKFKSTLSNSHLHPLIVNPLTFVIGITERVLLACPFISTLFLTKNIS